tara:strand:+ start:4610 stop:5107 length:498 start_codon:yes stop_codon:yes gene_type:complete
MDNKWSKLYASNGNFLFRAMFYEMSAPAQRIKHPPIFTLKPQEYKGLPSAYLTYMESIDEYDAAMKICPHMRAWDQLRQADWFLNGGPTFEGLKDWRTHMKQRDNSLAMAALQDKIAEGDVTAAKAVLANNKTVKKAGRTTKKTKAELASVSRIQDYNKGKKKNV